MTHDTGALGLLMQHESAIGRFHAVLADPRARQVIMDLPRHIQEQVAKDFVQSGIPEYLSAWTGRSVQDGRVKERET